MAAKDTALAEPLRKLLDEGATTGQFTISDSATLPTPSSGLHSSPRLPAGKTAATPKTPNFSTH